MKRRRITVQQVMRKLFQYFLQGMVVLAPFAITVWAVISLFTAVDRFLPEMAGKLFPSLFARDAEGRVVTIPGLGFIMIVLLVLLAGRLSSSFFVSRLVDLVDKVLERTPGIKFIYSSIKDLLEAFAGNKKKFDQAVLVNVDEQDIWRIGFITRQNMAEIGLPDHYTVYIPQSYAITGITYIVPRARVKPLTNLSPSEAMKFTLTGGVTEVETTAQS
jgi:uncharacterized membrane protein